MTATPFFHGHVMQFFITPLLRSISVSTAANTFLSWPHLMYRSFFKSLNNMCDFENIDIDAKPTGNGKQKV